MPRRTVIAQLPPVQYLPASVAAAEEARTAAIEARDNAQDKVRALMAGGSRFNPLVIGSQDRPSDAEKAAIAADDKLMDAALAAGDDASKVGRPNRDAYRRELETAEATLRATERAVEAVEARLLDTLKASRETTRANLRPAIEAAHGAFVRALDDVVTTRRDFDAAVAVLDFLDQLDDEPLDRIGYRIKGTSGERPIVGRPFVTVSFDQMVATMRAEAALPAPPEVETVDDVDNEPSTSTPHPDNRFASELSRRTRTRLASQGSIR